MMFVALIMRPWVLMMQTFDVRPRVLVDDALIMAIGTDMLRRLAVALNATHVYLQDMGTRVAP